MKNFTMKKISMAVVLCIVCSLLLTSVSADSVWHGDIIREDTEYSYDNIPAEKAKTIVNALSGDTTSTYIKGDVPITPNGLLCLFGHKISTGSVIATQHNAYSTSPKCKETTTFVEYCERENCGYYAVTGEIIDRIGCH